MPFMQAEQRHTKDPQATVCCMTQLDLRGLFLSVAISASSHNIIRTAGSPLAERPPEATKILVMALLINSPGGGRGEARDGA